MNTELSSKYDPSAVEAQAYQVWIDEKCFAADPAAPGEAYCIVIPPPNVTGALHLGHAINATLQDILIRVHRMMGFNTLWVPGIDHAGIATQAVVEKQLKEQENKTRHDVGREGLVERIWKWKQQYGDRILEQLKRLGASCDWDRTRFTLDDMCAKAVRETFFKLFKDGLIYRGKRLVNWDTFLQTSISDDEIYHETVKTSLWHIRYPIEMDGNALEGGCPQPPLRASAGEDARPPAVPPSPPYSGERAGVRGEAPEIATGDPQQTAPSPQPSPLSTGAREQERPRYMTVATTRPETMLGDTAVAVHSEDPRWNWAIGKHVRLPLTNRLIPIIADDILVDPKFGTGVVKVTPAHDPNDYAVWQRHKGQPDEIDLINILTPDGKIGSDRPEWSKYAGMKRAAARTQVVEDLKAAGLLEKEEPYETQVGHSDRSKTPVEPYLSDQWFVKMAPLAEPALAAVREGKIRFYPERHAQQYLSWLGEKRDWPVSRQLWWGHRIPVWRIAGSDMYRGWVDDLAEYANALMPKLRDWETRQLVSCVWVHNDSTSANPFEWAPSSLPDLVCLRGDNDEIIQELERGKGYVQDPDVLDTWFSSALWPHSTLGWPEQTAELAKFYPTSVLLTGRDIITLWVARMVMMGMYNMGAGSAVGSASRTAAEMVRGADPTGSGLSPSDGLSSEQQKSPHPNPLPEYRAREPEGSSLLVTPSPSHPLTPSSSRRPEARALGLPFLDVAINPTILDGKGERMSKSKGNGVDPVDIVDSYGADALRFTLTKMATETQDARMPVKRDANGKNTSDKFDEGRNFCNKLWNACRFALSNLEAIVPPAPSPAEGRKTNPPARAPAALPTVGSASRTIPPPPNDTVRDADPTNLHPLGKSSDEDLMLRTQQGDKLAFSQLYERYSETVLKELYQTFGNVEQVESIGQEVFLRGFRFAATYQYPHKFSTWLFTIMRNVAMNEPGRSKRSPIGNIGELNLKDIDMTGDPYQVAARATDDLEKQEEIARVLKALGDLPTDQKEVIVLGVFQGLSYAEMEEITGVEARALRSRMFHGLKGLAHLAGETESEDMDMRGTALPGGGGALASGGSPMPQSAGSTYTLIDRWIIARFNRTLAACDEAIKSYRFDVYAKSCYDFFWGDFCDWYVEAIKPAMKDPARSGQTADVLAAVLDGALRLMHPMIPFITETVWWRLNDVRPHRGIPGRIDCPPSKRLVLAKWPSATPVADSAEEEFPKLQAVIAAIRTIRNDYQVNPKQVVEVFIKANDDASQKILADRELVEMLATCNLKDVRADLPAVENAVTASAAGYDIFVTGLIDPNAEKIRLAKEIETKEKSVQAMKSRLSNEAYIAKAPPHLVQQSRDQLAAAEAELVKLKESLRKLE